MSLPANKQLPAPLTQIGCMDAPTQATPTQIKYKHAHKHRGITNPLTEIWIHTEACIRAWTCTLRECAWQQQHAIWLSVSLVYQWGYWRCNGIVLSFLSWFFSHILFQPGNTSKKIKISFLGCHGKSIQKAILEQQTNDSPASRSVKWGPVESLSHIMFSFMLG